MEKIWVVQNREESTLLAALRKTFPIVGDQPFQLCTVDGRKNITPISRSLWSTEGLRTMTAHKRSAVYILPEVQYAVCHDIINDLVWHCLPGLIVGFGNLSDFPKHRQYTIQCNLWCPCLYLCPVDTNQLVLGTWGRSHSTWCVTVQCHLVAKKIIALSSQWFLRVELISCQWQWM